MWVYVYVCSDPASFLLFMLRSVLQGFLSTDLVHDGGGEGLDAWLLVGERQLLQQVHVGQSILQGHVGRHGNEVSLKQRPRLT